MSRLILIRPPTVMPYSSITTSEGVPPIGIAYLSASLEKAGHQVAIIDAFGENLNKFTKLGQSKLLINGLTAEKIVERIPDNIEVIGISCMYSNEWLYSKTVIKTIIEKFPHIPVIVGGEHITADPEYVFKSCPGIHSCVLGEGERTVVELVSVIKEKRSLSTVKGIAFINNDGQFIITQPRDRIKAIDEIPWPSWDKVPLENYLKNGLGMGSVGGRNMPMIASRGCPFRCAFCTNRFMWKSQWIARDPKLVIEEMKYYIKRFNVSNFEFYDLTTIVQKEWIKKFTELLIQERLNLTWALPSGTRSEILDEEILARLYKSGCQALTYSPESASPNILKRLNKKVNLVNMLQSMRWAVKKNIKIKANMIVGLPGQTKMEALENFWFILKMAWLGIHDVAVFPFVPYPGSELFFQLVEEGRIQKNSNLYENFLSANIYNKVSGMKSWSVYISDRLIKFFTLGGIIYFYTWQFVFRPHRLISIIFRLVRNRPETMFDRTIHQLIRNFVLRRKKKV